MAKKSNKKSKDKGERRVYSVTAPRSEHLKLRVTAARRGQSLGQLLRELIERFNNENNEKTKGG